MTDDNTDGRRWLLTIEGAMLEAIGRATVQFSHLEAELDSFIWSLVAGYDALGGRDSPGARRALEAQRVGQAITARLLFRGKTEVMVALATHRFADRAEVMSAIGTLRNALDGAAEQRNRIVHAVWAGQGGGAETVATGTGVSVKNVLVPQVGMRQNVALHTQEGVAGFADTLAQLGYQMDELRKGLLPDPSATLGEGAA